MTIRQTIDAHGIRVHVRHDIPGIRGAVAKHGDRYDVIVNGELRRPDALRTVAHEVGHVALGHLDARQHLPEPVMEREADTYADSAHAHLQEVIHSATATRYTKLVGVSFRDRQRVIASLRPGQLLEIRMATYRGKPAAEVVTLDGRMAGYLRADLVAQLIEREAGQAVAVVQQVTGGTDGKLHGCNVLLYMMEG